MFTVSTLCNNKINLSFFSQYNQNETVLKFFVGEILFRNDSTDEVKNNFLRHYGNIPVVTGGTAQEYKACAQKWKRAIADLHGSTALRN